MSASLELVGGEVKSVLGAETGEGSVLVPTLKMTVPSDGTKPKRSVRHPLLTRSSTDLPHHV